MTAFFLLFAAGLLAAPFSPKHPGILPLVIGALSLLIPLVARTEARRRLGAWLVWGGLGFLLGTTNVMRIAQTQLAEAHSNSEVSARFHINSNAVVGDRSTSFVATVLAVDCSLPYCAKLVGKKLRVQWYQGRKPVAAGQVWQARLRLKRPRGLANPAGFDYHAWLLAEGIYATAVVRAHAELLGEAPNLARLRESLAQRLFASDDLTHQRFFRALLLGDKTAIATPDWALLKRTGTIHLMAISGLHVGFSAWLAFMLGRGLAHLLALAVRDGAKLHHYLPVMCALVGSLGYSLLAGFSVPTARAFTACAVVCICSLWLRRIHAVTVLSLALLVVGLCQPLAALAPGFWLSFGAVAVLLYAFAGRRTGKFAGLLHAQGVLFVGLLAPLFVLGQGVSLVAPFANLVAVPVVTFIIVPGLFLALALVWLPSVAVPLLVSLDAVFGALWWVLLALGSWADLWQPARPQVAALGLLLAAGALLLLGPRGLRLQWLGAGLVVAVFAAPLRSNNVFRLTVLDAGQGLAVVMQGPTQTWVYDTGARFSERFDIGSGVIAPFLHQVGQTRVNLLVSHSDGDHAGGAAGLADTVAIDRLLTGEPMALAGAEREACVAGATWRDGPVLYQVIWPEVADVLADNDASCVLLVTIAMGATRYRVLLPGDISRAVEAKLLGDLPEAVDLVIAPHHGSKTSSSAAFVKRLHPARVVFSAGFNNRYNHPHPEVVARYAAIGSEMFDTALDGAITFTLVDSGAVEVERFRASANRLWY